jgi:serine/threonine-protein kinase HipA
LSLDVHLRGERIGTLFLAADDDYRFAYSAGAVAANGSGQPLLSTSLPVRPEPFSGPASRAYVEGLLPEGRARERAAVSVGVDPGDSFGLVAASGRDCCGAVVFLPEGEDPRADGGRWLGEEQLAGLLAGHPGAGPAPSYSLGGARHKLALIRAGGGGRWALPSAAEPSTHVVKPESGEFPGLLRNELFCMELARSVGLPVAQAALEEIGGRPCLVSRRFDREGAARVHKEDFCQALGFPPPGGALDEEERRGPGFAEAAGLLRAVDREDAISLLVSVAFFNYVVGNGDAHGCNYGLLHEEGGTRLAPFCDLSSTLVYDMPTHVGLVVNEDYDQTVYLLEMGWISEECGLDFDDLRKLAATVARRVGDALEPMAERAGAEGWHAPVIDDVVALASERASGLGFEADY